MLQTPTPTTHPFVRPGLSLDGLENVYDQLAQAIDTAHGQGKTELFLTKLALLCANALGDDQQFVQLLKTAARDL